MINNSLQLKGKKLLILGGAPNEVPIVLRAQSMGIYVIVTDMYIDHNVSPAKDIADEYWDISWSDIGKLKEKCSVECVDGVLGGFSEIKIESQIELCKELNLPCYINKNQLEITRNKSLFKSECRKYGVPVIKEYASLEDVDSYPVIVKPVDRAGSIGVGIAHNAEELVDVYKYALEKSLIKDVVIERYITNATEMDVHYAICDGKISLLTTDDIIQAECNEKDGKVVQSAWMYPSRYNSDFLNKVDKKLKKMIAGMGITNGTIFFSGFVDNKGDFMFFECGFRLWGEQEFEYDYIHNGLNYLDIYIHHALFGTTNGILRNSNTIRELKGVSLNLYVTGGIITKVEGLDELEKSQDCFLCIRSSHIGKECSFDNAILTKAGLLGFANQDTTKLQEDIRDAYKKIRILNQNGEDMLYDHINVDLIKNYWN